MGSKIFLLLGLSIAFALLLSSEVAARDLAETTTKTVGFGGSEAGGHYNGGGVSGRHGNFKARAAVELLPPSYGSSCTHHCYGMCCSAAEAKALEARTQVKPHN